MSNRNDSTHFLVSITYDWRDDPNWQACLQAFRRVETANAALFASHHVSQPIFSFADPCIAVAPEICGPLNEVWCLLRTNATKNCRALVGKGLESNHVLVCEVPTTLQSFCRCVQGMNQVNAANLSYFNKEEAPSTACLVFQRPKRAATDPGFEWLQITLKINVGLGRPPVKMDMWQWKGYTRSSTTPASGSYLCALQCAGVERAGFCSVIDSSDPLPRYLAIHPRFVVSKCFKRFLFQSLFWGNQRVSGRARRNNRHAASAIIFSAWCQEKTADLFGVKIPIGKKSHLCSTWYTCTL
jgi:hypothetical protein